MSTTRAGTGAGGPALSVEAALDFEIGLPDTGSGSRAVTGSLRGEGTELQLSIDDLSLFAGRSDTDTVRDLAAGLASQGVQVHLVTEDGPVLTLGAARGSWWQRRITGSAHMRVRGLAGLRTLARARLGGSGESQFPTASMVPPATLWPPVPTLRRAARRRATRTHLGGGGPRLVLVPRGDGTVEDDGRREFPLEAEVTSIGSAPECDIRLVGLEALHAQVRRDGRDEFVLVNLAKLEDTRINGAPARESVLRTATRLDLGPRTLTFFREEFADHGRPYGGRLGGEVGRQRPQPPRA